jgi:hypothetical protein
MTTKTTYAMFAVAAIAAMSFGFTPAFAATYVYSDVDDIGSSGVEKSNLETASCGTGTCVSMTEASASQDYVTAWYGMYGSNNVCTVTTEVTVTGEGTTSYNRGTISGLHSDRINMQVDAGDDIVVVNYYSNCS